MCVTEVLRVPWGCCRNSTGTSTLVLSCCPFSDHSIHLLSYWRQAELLHCLDTHALKHTLTCMVPGQTCLKCSYSWHCGDPTHNHPCPHGTVGCMLLVTLWLRNVVHQTTVFHHHLHSNSTLSHRDNESHLGLWRLLPPQHSTFNHMSLSDLQPSTAPHNWISNVL